MKEFREEDQILNKVKRIHMIGIGGSGMCPLAEILNSKGYIITGSDNNESDPLNKVRKFAEVSLGHKKENVIGAQLVVYSAAISKENEELLYAKELHIPTMERSHLLGAMTRLFDNVIGVCGTHGKTTTTSLITQILIQAEKNPNAIIGGKLPLIDHYGITGDSETLVVESCEFQDTFLQLSEDIAILLNIDNDHLEYFKTMENLTNSFSKFFHKSKIGFVNGDDKLALKAANNYQGTLFTFGFNEDNDYVAKNMIAGKKGYHYDIYYKGQFLDHIETSIPGAHNIYNTLVSYALCHYLGVDRKSMVNSIKQFSGASRRFEFLGNYGFELADDYAHHPSEIKATILAAKQLAYDRVIVVFQPFTYSRSYMLKQEFAEVLDLADEIVLSEIMGSREVNTYNIYSKDIASLMKKKVTVIEKFDDIKQYIYDNYHSGDLVITMGCGDIYKVSHQIAKEKESN